ncbi:MAG TPA: hypothetical protein VKE74_27925, partial [Gemmataceae bacterium]|nr:hypothetical protein [Gemmataceae bacterium]
LVRPSADHAHWLAPGSVTAKKDGTVYAVIRTKYLNKPVFPAASLKKLEGDGWTEIEGEVATTFPGNENWEWTAFKKEIKKGEVDLELKGIKWNTRSAVLFVFK